MLQHSISYEIFLARLAICNGGEKCGSSFFLRFTVLDKDNVYVELRELGFGDRSGEMFHGTPVLIRHRGKMHNFIVSGKKAHKLLGYDKIILPCCNYCHHP